MKRRASGHTDAVSEVESNRRRPDVIVDFVFENGLLFVAVQNIGDEPALKVKTTFEKPFTGLDGTQETSSLPLFRKIEFLAPHKEIRTILDSTTSYFRRRQPEKIKAILKYRDRKNTLYEATFKHDLSIYRDITYVHPATNEQGKE
jgi:hypothetical protein